MNSSSVSPKRLPLIVIVSKKHRSRIINKEEYSDDDEPKAPVLPPPVTNTSYQRPHSAKHIRETLRKLISNFENVHVVLRPKSAAPLSKRDSKESSKKKGSRRRSTKVDSVRDSWAEVQTERKTTTLPPILSAHHHHHQYHQSAKLGNPQLIGLKSFEVDNSGQKYVALLIVHSSLTYCETLVAMLISQCMILLYTRSI